jgi:heme-degrading monooxygenase HmoA
MRHVRIAKYELTAGTVEEVADAAKEGLLPKFRAMPGFVRYGIADGGDKTLMSVSIWETHEAAESASPTAAEWVSENISDRLQLLENFVGDFVFYQGVETPQA